VPAGHDEVERVVEDRLRVEADVLRRRVVGRGLHEREVALPGEEQVEALRGLGLAQPQFERGVALAGGVDQGRQQCRDGRGEPAQAQHP
jgi:hypothetical protein